MVRSIIGKPGGTVLAGVAVSCFDPSSDFWLLILSISSLRSGRGRFMAGCDGVEGWNSSGMFIPAPGAPDTTGTILAENGDIGL